MLPHLFRSAVRVASRALWHRQLAVITAAKSLSDKKKKIYESQSMDGKKNAINNKKMSP
jgi:lysophospholipid acyltransferase (LPLAT)-like uncharacterized protein